MRRREQGFTIIELMIATSVFSVILLLITTGVVAFSRQYQKGVITNSTQTVARNTLNEVARSLQFSSGSVTPIMSGGSEAGKCINSKPYFYLKDRQIDGPVSSTTTKHALVTSEDGCAVAAPDLRTLNFASSGLTRPRELIGTKMRLTHFNVSCAGDVCTVEVTVAYGDNDLLTGSGKNIHCAAGKGNQYCAVSSLQTRVAVRLE